MRRSTSWIDIRPSLEKLAPEFEAGSRAVRQELSQVPSAAARPLEKSTERIREQGTHQEAAADAAGSRLIAQAGEQVLKVRTVVESGVEDMVKLQKRLAEATERLSSRGREGVEGLEAVCAVAREMRAVLGRADALAGER